MWESVIVTRFTEGGSMASIEGKPHPVGGTISDNATGGRFSFKTAEGNTLINCWPKEGQMQPEPSQGPTSLEQRKQAMRAQFSRRDLGPEELQRQEDGALGSSRP